MTETIIEIGPERADQPHLETLIRRTLESEGASLTHVSVAFVGPATIERMNRRYRNKPYPTDVLSFPFDDSFPSGRGGEVIVCPEQADPNQPHAIDRLVVHGILHLLGYDDATDEQLAEMERRTDRVMEQFRG